MAACCSLDTLSTVELDAIRDDLLLNGCPKCGVDDPAPFHLLALRQSLQVIPHLELKIEFLISFLYRLLVSSNWERQRFRMV